MRVIFRIIKRDFNSIVKSLPVFITILVFCFLPSTYAIFTIKASWNPYSKSNMSRLPIAVVNRDEGSNIKGKTINVGNQITDELKKDKSVKWVIIDEWQGNYGLNTGKYYSLIEIPEDFSNKLLTLATSDPQKPNIIYKSNEKLNAAATKITSQVKDTLADQIKSNFIKICDRKAIKQMNSLGKKLNKNKPEILQIKDSMENSIKAIDKTKKYFSEVNENSKGIQDYLNKLKSDVPKLSKQISSLQDIVNHEKSLAQSTKRVINSAQNNLTGGINKLQTQNTQFQSLLSSLENMNNEFSGSSVTNSTINQMDNLNNSMLEEIDSDLKILNTINDILPNNGVAGLINALNVMKNSIRAEEGYLAQLKQLVNSGGSKENINSIIDQISIVGNELSSDAVNVSNSFYSSTSQALDDVNNNIDMGLENYNDILEYTRKVVPQLNSLVNTGNSVSEISISHVNKVNKRLGDIQNKLNQLNSNMNMINEKNLDRIIDIMEKNPEISSLLSSPVELKNVQLYNLGLFGYGVTPFFTTLSIWVGVLLLSVILTYECREFEDGTKVSMIQAYVGKLFLFIAISLIQTSITLLGEFLLLGIRPVNIPAMIGIAFAVSITFTIIVFTCVFMFGNAGKGLAAVIMILQIFGTGGVYPLEIVSKRLASLAPFLPFTYAINGFREAIAGPNWAHFLKILVILAVFAGIFLLIAPFKKVFEKQIQQMEDDFKKSQL
ncbi:MULTISPECIES: YhgE/Pip domain-containing protein [Clostridium]|jgi:putative membrane protein|uniref:YhgE/Pip family protein n=1 Tax=Clostridium lapidicellarium TaxID=3240931 RepID=A0ABV4DW78_9CLOT|nr:YhgE/Pip domain-containing protein [uncultured Clostridium sp.]